MTATQVLMLGTGTPNAEPNRVSAGLAIAVDNQPYLLDCGHGVVQRVVAGACRRQNILDYH